MESCVDEGCFIRVPSGVHRHEDECGRMCERCRVREREDPGDAQKCARAVWSCGVECMNKTICAVE